MASRVCTHCGEVFDDRELVCPHCGADRDQAWSEAPVEHGYGRDALDQDEYEAFLASEGLGGAPKPGRKGCALLVAAVGIGLLLL